MRHGELDHILASRLVTAQHIARRLQVADDFIRLREQGFAGIGQAGRVRAAIEKVDTSPGLKRLDAARKRRLSHMPELGRT